MTYGNYPDLRGVSRVLVVKLRHLGDVLLTAPLFSELQRALPSAEIDVYLYEEAKPMLEGHPAIAQLIGFDQKKKKGSFFRRICYEWRIWSFIRRQKYDLVLNLTEGDRGAFVAKIAKAKYRVGFSPKGRLQKKLYTHVIKPVPGLRHQVERNLDALRTLGIFPPLERRELSFHIGDEVMASMRQKMGDQPFLLIHPTSRWRFKCWPVSKFRELIRRLCLSGYRIVLSSGPDGIERERVAAIAEGLQVENMAGKTSLKELGALIALSDTLVCSDSVALHLASALKKRVVALFGPTSEITWGPWRNPDAQVVLQNLSCRPCYQDGCAGSKYSDCLETLSVESVFQAITGNPFQNRRASPFHVLTDLQPCH